MSFDRPTLKTLVDRVRADVLARMQQDDILRRADAEVYARVQAALTHGLYGFVDWLSRQVIYDTAEADWLARWASIWGVPRKPAAVAVGEVVLTTLAGAVIPQYSTLQALDGVQYETTAEVTASGTSTTVSVQALMAGAAGNRDAGQTLTLISPIDGVQSAGVAGLLSGGADEESDDALRARLLERIQSPPQGGALADYEAWALANEGVTRVWVYPEELGAGTVTVRFVRDDDGTGLAILPSEAEVDIVQAYIDARRPVTAAVTVVSPVAVVQDFEISMVTPNTSAVRAAVEAELADLLRREAAPGGTLLISHVRAAISAAAGETDYTLVSPTANVICGTGEMLIMGSVTWPS